jgi:HD superfamily phosphohydrolase YqeK
MVKTNLKHKIKSAEKIYKDLLESFFICNYPENHLISHGLDHHRRVWKFAIELINHSAEEYQNSDFILKLIIACFLHDSGMSVDPGIRHGLHSKKLCEKFLMQNHMPVSDFSDVLQAIEHHDDKEYISPRNDDLLLKILSVADDLDAFGFIGIYRYAEIYILRGISTADLGKKILENASNRFRNFSSSYEKFPDLVAKHQKRFDILTEFFNQYNSQCAAYLFNSKIPSGNCGIIEIIMENLKDDMNENPGMIYSKTSYDDPEINFFFKKLQVELS